MYCAVSGQGGVKMEPGSSGRLGRLTLGASRVHYTDEAIGPLRRSSCVVMDVMTALLSLSTGACSSVAFKMFGRLGRLEGHVDRSLVVCQ